MDSKYNKSKAGIQGPFRSLFSQARQDAIKPALAFFTGMGGLTFFAFLLWCQSMTVLMPVYGVEVASSLAGSVFFGLHCATWRYGWAVVQHRCTTRVTSSWHPVSVSVSTSWGTFPGCFAVQRQASSSPFLANSLVSSGLAPLNIRSYATEVMGRRGGLRPGAQARVMSSLDVG